jgi:hypothetical protein
MARTVFQLANVLRGQLSSSLKAPMTQFRKPCASPASFLAPLFGQQTSSMHTLVAARTMSGAHGSYIAQRSMLALNRGVMTEARKPWDKEYEVGAVLDIFVLNVPLQQYTA